MTLVTPQHHQITTTNHIKILKHNSLAYTSLPDSTPCHESLEKQVTCSNITKTQRTQTSTSTNRTYIQDYT